MNAASMSNVFSGISAVGSAASGYAQYKQGQAQKGAYDYNANLALDKMSQQAESSDLQFSRLMGRQRSLYAKAGVDIASGSPLLVMADTAMQAEEEQNRIKASGESEAAMDRFSGDMAEYSGKVGGMATFLSGISKAAESVRMTQPGVNSPWLR